MSMPRILVYAGIFLASVALVILAGLYREQATTSTRPRLQVIPDMDNQSYHRAQSASDFFADGRAMRVPVEGTVSRGALQEDDALHLGKVDEAWITYVPGGIDADLMARGRERYQVFCAACHGATGSGDGMVSRRAANLAEGTWVTPSDLTAAVTLDRPEGELFDFISHGIRKMPAYDAQIPIADRWAIVGYVRALQRRAHGQLADVPDNLRAEIK
jgi:mono/diheme cytochrome c family protein